MVTINFVLFKQEVYHPSLLSFSNSSRYGFRNTKSKLNKHNMLEESEFCFAEFPRYWPIFVQEIGVYRY